MGAASAVVATTLVTILAVFFTPAQVARADALYDPYGNWNGYKVYLSPARHDDAGSRGECQGNNENIMAYNVASVAANGDYYRDVFDPSSTFRNLRARGYKVRIGTGTLRSAIDNSNAWGANLHIPIHSNAKGTASNCTRTDVASFGTVTIYRDGNANQQRLAGWLRDIVGPSSPGTTDYSCWNPGNPCTTIDLGELREVNAVAGYLESEFHDWNTGVNWLSQSYWPWRIGSAVDNYTGFPR
jgi:hypothetical protein